MKLIVGEDMKRRAKEEEEEDRKRNRSMQKTKRIRKELHNMICRPTMKVLTKYHNER